MKARESPLPETKLLPPRRSNHRADSSGGGSREGKRAETALAPATPALCKAPGFVVKMYGLNVAQGWEQYSTKIHRGPLDIRAVVM